MRHPPMYSPARAASASDAAGVTRRSLMAGAAAILAARPAASQTEQTAAVPEAELSVTEALRARRSVRAFAERPVASGLLAELLWAAFGINRPAVRLHTAPSWRGAADATVHVAGPDGVQAYLPETATLELRLQEDIRGQLSPQPFVATAPLCLIHISDLRRLSAADEDEQKMLYAQVDAAVIAQNVYLFAAARGLGTCLVGGLDRAAITEAMALPPHAFPTFVQPVGWPA